MADPSPALADVVLLDDRLVAPAEATVSAFDRGLLYGESLFETVKVVEGAPCLWPAHRERLAAGCGELGLPLDAAALDRGVRSLLAARPATLGALRVQVTGGVQPGGGRGLTAPSAGRRPRVVATVQEVTAMAPERYRAGVAVVTVPGLSRPLPWLKSGSYLASVAAKARADAAGAFEGLFATGEPPMLLEGAFSSLLLWDGVGLISPPPGDVLPGVTSAAVLALARETGIDTAEGPVTRTAALRGGLLLTGSLLGVCPCGSLDGSFLVPVAVLADALRGALEERETASRKTWKVGSQGAKEVRP